MQTESSFSSDTPYTMNPQIFTKNLIEPERPDADRKPRERTKVHTGYLFLALAQPLLLIEEFKDENSSLFFHDKCFDFRSFHPINDH